MEGPRILIGENPILIGSHVSDLRTAQGQSPREQIVLWTQPPGIRRSRQTYHIESLGQPVERVFRITTSGDVSELNYDAQPCEIVNA